MSQINPSVLELQRWAPVIDWLAFEGERVVIPTAARGEMLKLIRVGHIGIVMCRNGAKELIFWPNMHSQIEEMVSNCPTCLQFCISNAPKELMISHEFPEFVWQVVAAHLFQIDAEHYLFVLNYHSRYFELEKMSSTTCPEVISRIRAIFARFGIPEKVVSDNGSPLAGAEFSLFSEKWEFHHVTTSPPYPKENGLFERFVQTAKHLLKKAKTGSHPPYLSLK